MRTGFTCSFFVNILLFNKKNKGEGVRNGTDKNNRRKNTNFRKAAIAGEVVSSSRIRSEA